MNISKPTSFLKSVMPLAVASLALSLLAYAPSVHAQGDAGENSTRVYDNIPANWDGYMIAPELMDKYSGEPVEQLVFYDDLIKPRLQYQTLRVTRDQEFAVLQGRKSFVVVDPKHIILGTANTGVNIIKTRGCRENLRRAKYVLLDMEKPNRRYRRGQYIDIMTRFRSGLKSCRIDSIHEWSGPVDLTQLKAENDAIIEKRGTVIQPVTEHLLTHDGRPIQPIEPSDPSTH